MAKTKITTSSTKKAYIIALLREPYKSEVWGYRVATLGGDSKTANKGIITRDIPKAKVLELMYKGSSLENATLDSSGDLEFTQGTSTGYPQALVGQGVKGLVSKNGLTVLYQVRLNTVDGRVIKYGVADARGTKIYHVTGTWLAQQGKSFFQTNYTPYKNPNYASGSTSSEDEYLIRAKAGTFPITIFYDKRERLNSLNSVVDSAEDIKRKSEENEVIRANLKDIETDRAKKYAEVSQSAIKAEELVKEVESDKYDKFQVALDNYLRKRNTSAAMSDEQKKLRSDLAEARKEYLDAMERARSGLIKHPENKNLLPYIEVDRNLDTSIHREIEIDFNLKMQKVTANIKKLAPFFSSMLIAIPVQKTMSLPTMAVNETRMYVNPEFLNTLTIGEASFIILHELMHIRLQHSSRGIGKKHYLWNIACDLVINERIRDDFVPNERNRHKISGEPNYEKVGAETVETGEIKVLFNDPDGKPVGSFSDASNYALIKCPDIGIFCETLDMDYDASIMSEEYIYSILLAENGGGNRSQHQPPQEVPYDGLNISQVMTRLVEIAQQALSVQTAPSVPYNQINLDDMTEVKDHVGDILWGEVVQLDTLLDEMEQAKTQGTDYDHDLMKRVAEKLKDVGGIFAIMDMNKLLPDMSGRPDANVLTFAVKKKVIMPTVRHDMPTILASIGRIAELLAVSDDVPDFNFPPPPSDDGDDGNGGDDGVSDPSSASNGSSGNEDDSSDSSDGNAKSSGGSSGSNSDNKSEENSDGDSGDGSDSKDSSDDDSDEQGKGNGENSDGESEENEDGKGSGENSEGDSEENEDGDGSGDDWDNAGDEPKDSEVTNEIFGEDDDFRNEEVDVDLLVKGKKVRVKVRDDLMSDKRVVDAVKEGEKPKHISKEMSRQTNERVVQQTIKDFPNKESGWGESTSALFKRRLQIYEEAEKRDWYKLLENLCKKTYETSFSLARPNKLMQNSLGAYLASESKQEGKPRISDLKIAIDTSGSISDDILAKILSEIAYLLNKYKIKGSELIYWDTDVVNVGEFNTLKELLKINPLGGGGTDVECVFKYLAGESNFRGNKQKSKIKDMTAILIFTDGWFSPPSKEKWEKKFGKKVIWVLYDDTKGLPYGLIDAKTNELIFGKVSLLDREK